MKIDELKKNIEQYKAYCLSNIVAADAFLSTLNGTPTVSWTTGFQGEAMGTSGRRLAVGRLTRASETTTAKTRKRAYGGTTAKTLAALSEKRWRACEVVALKSGLGLRTVQKTLGSAHLRDKVLKKHPAGRGPHIPQEYKLK